MMVQLCPLVVLGGVLCPMFASFGLLHYIEAIISDAAAQSSECTALHPGKQKFKITNKSHHRVNQHNIQFWYKPHFQAKGSLVNNV